MKHRIKAFSSSGGFISFTLGFFLFIVLSIPILVGSGGHYYSTGDHNIQAIPFIYHMRDCVLSGEMCWDWSVGLGGQFLSEYTYYNLFSPFTWLCFIVPRDAIVYSLPVIYAIKAGVGSMLGYFYAKRFIKNKHYAVLAGVIYMFSSFSGYNIVFHFADIIALFPLLLIALEELCVNKRRVFFGVVVLFMALLNYYFFVGEAVFCVIYYFCRLKDKDFGGSIKQFFSVAVEAVAGFAVAVVILFPVFSDVFSSQKATGMLSLSHAPVYDSVYDYLKIIQSVVMFPDPFRITTLFPTVQTVYPFGTLHASVAAYLPLFGCCGVVSYLFKKKHDGFCLVVYASVVMALVPVLNQLFSALNASYYARWYYMPLLIGAVISFKSLEDEDISQKPGIIAQAVGLAGLIIYQLLVDTDALIANYCSRALFTVYQNIFQFGITIITFAIFLVVLQSRKEKKDFYAKLYILTTICCFICFGYYSWNATSAVPDVEYYLESVAYHETLPDFVTEDDRISFRSEQNFNLVWKGEDFNGVDATPYFNSLIDNGFRQFLDDCGFGLDTGLYTDIKITARPVCDLTSVRYFFNPEDTKKELYSGMERVGDFGIYAIYENDNYIPMGFTYDSMISRSAFLEIEDKDLRRRTLLKALVVEDTSEFADILTDISNEAGAAMSDEEYKSYIADRRAGACSSCEKSSTGLTAKITLDKENVVFFSGSYNDNWKAFVDGVGTEVYNVNCGLIGVRVPEGKHEIVLEYELPTILTIFS